ncbi:MAG: hypothetical protein JXR10_00535 [Cyclobacteriaceae bacterium]
MEEVEIVKSIAGLIQKDLNLDAGISDSETSNPLETLESWLASQLKILLDQDFNSLLNSMYRLDIKEERLKSILNLAPVAELPQLLAKEIIQRERQKVMTRRAYAQSSKDSPTL